MIRLLLLMALAAIQLSYAGEGPAIVAHRGASHDAPENTLAAFKLAWEQGADAIEGDFFLTEDGEIVCTHDAVTGRLNPGKVELEVAKSTLAELQALDVGSWKGAKWKGERMPTLRDVLRTVPGDKRILIEVKCGAEILPVLRRELGASSLRSDQITIISFQKAVVLNAKIAMPRIEVFWLCSLKENKKTGKIEPGDASIMKTLKLTRADGFSCGNHESLNREFLQRVRDGGVETHCWTINDAQRARELAAMGMESITTDRPALIRKALRR